MENPLTGPDGAASVYGPQKGATAADVLDLDAGLTNLVHRLEDAGWVDATALADSPGAGSAGGLGFAGMLFGGRLVSGADFFLDLLDFDTHVRGCDLVITGEGKLDSQTLAESSCPSSPADPGPSPSSPSLGTAKSTNTS